VFAVAGNFAFLKEDFPDLENMGVLAEGYLYSDPNGCMYKMGALAETLVNHIFVLAEIKPSASDTTQDSRIKTLLRLKIIPTAISDMLHSIRKSRNEAVHAGYDCLEQTKTLLQMTYTISVWFIQAYGSVIDFVPIAFKMPDDERGRSDYNELLAENQKILAELEKMQATLSTPKYRHIDAAQRKKNTDRATHNLKLSERETRYLIDEQLRKVGWEADSVSLRYSKGTSP
jgi:type I restriction enzyme R subunit